MIVASGLALLLAGAALPAADQAAVDASASALFAPYLDTAVDGTPPWMRPIFSAETAALIDRWELVRPYDEPDELNDGDWLCQCQEIVTPGFRVEYLGTSAPGPGLAEVKVRVDPAGDGWRNIRLILKKEAGGWMLDDLYGPDFPKGVKQQLRATIAREEKAK